MEVEIDTKTVTEAGFDKYLIRSINPQEAGIAGSGVRTVDPNNFVGGTIGGEGILFLGSNQFKLDGRNKRITIEDKVLIGYP